MKRYIYSISLLFLVQVAMGKTNEDLQKANYLYSHLAYHEAIDYYQKVAGNLNDPLHMAHLADCYRLTKDYAQANAWYAKAVPLNGCPDDAKLHYAQTLMNTGDYTQALPLLQQYAKLKPEDRRVRNLVTSCEQAGTMKKEMPRGSIQMLAFNTDHSEFGPSLRRNELFFTSDTIANSMAKTDNWTGHPFYNIYSVNCVSGGDCSVLKELKGKTETKYHDGPAAFSADGNTMYFTRTSYKQRFIDKGPQADANDVVHLQIMIASDYDEAANKYKKVTPFKYNSLKYSVAHPAVSKDGNMMLFTSDMPGGQGGTDLYISMKNADGSWSEPVNAGTDINTEGDELFPYMDADSSLYFASNGHVGYGGLDIYRSTWDNAAHKFSAPVNMGMPLNSSYDDMSLVMNDAGSMGFFASDRPAQRKEDNIYSFSPQSLYLAVTGIDSFTGKPIPGLELVLKSGMDTTEHTGSPMGVITTPLHPQVYYAGTLSAFDYQPKDITVSTIGNTKRSDTIRTVVRLKPNSKINYNVVVYDETSYRPIENPTIVFHKTGMATADTIQLNTGAQYTAEMEPNNSYQVFAVKDNYYSNEKSISTKGINPSSGSVKIVDTLFMKKLEVGGSYKIDNIYYDYNKANVREDAKPSLERLISLLNQYPAMKIQVNAHTDCRGADNYNLKLSNARAHSVITYLEERGISITRLKYRGYGETMPVHKCASCNECSEADHQANRRTEFTIVGM